MEVIEERRTKHGYEVAYGCEGNIVKIVRVNSKKFFSKNRSFLEIQKVGLDEHLEALEFEDGEIHTLYRKGLAWNSHFPNIDSKSPYAVELLRMYANEFREIFEANEELRNHLVVVFKQLAEYLQFD